MTVEKEKWLPVVGYEGLYEVSDMGRVRGVKRYHCDGRILKQNTFNMYPSVTLSNNPRKKIRKTVHLLVLGAFVGERPEGMHACHNNGISSDNRLENLRWDSPENNAKDKVRHGTLKYGDKHYVSKLKERDIPKIVELRKKNMSHRKIADKYGVCSQAIDNIFNGKTWKQAIQKLEARNTK